jgi:hypothetical protein
MVRSPKEWLVAGGEQSMPPRALPSLKGVVGEIRLCCTCSMRCAGVTGLLRTRTPTRSTTTCPSPPILPRRPAGSLCHTHKIPIFLWKLECYTKLVDIDASRDIPSSEEQLVARSAHHQRSSWWLTEAAQAAVCVAVS